MSHEERAKTGTDACACLICHSESKSLFSATVLRKHFVTFFKCESCGFIQTEKPYWLDEAYSEAISLMDVGLLSRNINLSNILPAFFTEHFNAEAPFLDYGGGYGIFVRLMRDQGFDFYRQDKHCENIFAKGFELEDLHMGKPIELITAFEVFEHLPDPLNEIREILSHGSSLLFTTHLQPNDNIKSARDWGYFAVDTGQHISFYTRQSLEILANTFGMNFYTNNSTLHLFTKKFLNLGDLELKMPTRPAESLIARDVNMYIDRWSGRRV